MGRLAVHQGTRVQVVEDGDTTLLSSVQHDPVPHRATESLYASPLTESLYSHTPRPPHLTLDVGSSTCSNPSAARSPLFRSSDDAWPIDGTVGRPACGGC